MVGRTGSTGRTGHAVHPRGALISSKGSIIATWRESDAGFGHAGPSRIIGKAGPRIEVGKVALCESSDVERAGLARTAMSAAIAMGPLILTTFLIRSEPAKALCGSVGCVISPRIQQRKFWMRYPGLVDSKA